MMRLALAVLALALFVSPARANMITVTYSGTVDGFTDQLSIFTGNPDNIVPITDIHTGDSFTGTTDFSFDPNKPVGPFGEYDAAIVTTFTVGSHTFSTALTGTDPFQVAHDVATVGNDPNSFSLWYQSTMSLALPLPFLLSTLDFTGNSNLPADTPFWTAFVANLNTFQTGQLSFVLTRGEPGVWRDELEFAGHIDSLFISRPEPGTFGAAAIGLVGVLVLARRRVCDGV